MSSKNKKIAAIKAKYSDAEGSAKNALDDLDFDEDNVFDEVDDETYARRVESRREASFVVDDDGLGYDDDGEEHLLDGEDDDLGKRARAMDQKELDKAQKKSKRNQEALAAAKQTNTLKSSGWVKSTTAAAGVKPAKESKVVDAEAVDIDDFFGSAMTSAATFKGRPQSFKPSASNSMHARPNSHGQFQRAGAPSSYRHQPTFNASSDDHAESEPYYDNNDDNYMESSTADADISSSSSSSSSSSNNNFSNSNNSEHHSSSSMNATADAFSSRSIPEAMKEEESSSSHATSNKMPQLKATKKFTMADVEVKAAASSSDSAADGFASSTSGPAAGKLDPSKWLFNLSTASGASSAVKSEAAMDIAGGSASQPSENFVKMFWMDAFENNGVVYLFGKIALVDGAPPVSGCLAVYGCQRNLFVLPRVKGDAFTKDGKPERHAVPEVYEEIRKVLQNVIPNHEGSGFKCKLVKRNYVFECGDVPRGELDYLKVTYSSKYGVPNQNVCTNGGKSFQRIFGSGSTPLEWFLLKRELMGPCWIQVRSPKPISDANLSWCKIEVSIDDPKCINKLKNPPPSPYLTTLALSMKTIVNPSTHVHEIVAISGMVHQKVDADAETDESPKYWDPKVGVCRRFTYIRQLGTSSGPNYPAVFPHDFATKSRQTGFIETFGNERALLSRFFSEIGRVDPDIICSHNLFGFEFEILLNRAVENKVPDWSRLGRIRRAKAPKPTDRDLTPGRVLCDTYKAAKEFLRETSYSLTHLSKSQLGVVDREEIDPVDVPRYFLSSEGLLRLAEASSRDSHLVHRLTVKLQVVPLTKQLTVVAGNLWARTMRGGKAERNEYLLLHQFHNGVSGMYGSSGEEAKRLMKYILPEKKSYNDNSSGTKSRFKNAMEEDDDEPETGGKVGGVGRKRAKAAYAGGLVLEPKKGLYDSYILLLDFNSLYPSLIQEYNLCFTTIDWTKYMFDEKKEPEAATPSKSKSKAGGGSAKAAASSSSMTVEGVEEDTQGADNSDDDDDEEGDGDANSGSKALPPLPDTQLHQGVLPRVIKELVARRKEVKKLLKDAKDPAEKQSLDIRQKAYKLTANSMYGCLGFSFSRFYARPIAALVTAKGREALQRTVATAESTMGYTVIYGDTDSVMINTNCTDLAVAKDIGIKIRQEVNKMYRTLELDTDGIFKSMLLLKKKKYAALSIKEGKDGAVTYEAEMKGLDLVRRDWCPISKDTGTEIVEQILSGKPRHEIVIAIHDYLEKLGQDIRGNKFELNKFVITKGLNKNPKDYPDVKGQPHLQVALTMLKANKPVNIGDHIPYVICKEGDEGASHVLRAHHPDEIERSEGKLTVDFEWYLSSQILPPVQRLCEPIEGTSPAILAKQLGLESSKFISNSRANEEDEWGFNAAKVYMEDSERFQECDPLMVTCRGCEQSTQFPGLSSETNVGSLSCPYCNVRFYGYDDTRGFASYISNRVTLLVRQSQKLYYECWLRCDDPTCGRRTMQQSTRNFDRCTENCHGKMEPEFSDQRMYNQIKYLQSLFDIDRLMSRAAIIDTPEMKAKLVTVKNFSEKQMAFFKDVKGVITQLVESSGYNWIMPSIWTILRNNSKK